LGQSRLARQSFRAHDDRSRVETLGWFAGRYAIVGSDEGQRHEPGYFRHGSLLAGIGMKSSAHIGVRDGLHQFGDLGFQIFVRDNQRESEEAIREALGRLMRGRTVIAIAHRLATLRNFDRVVMLKAGKIIEDGSPDRLMQGRGLYGELVTQEMRRLATHAA
jgi:hypothetical protein